MRLFRSLSLLLVLVAPGAFAEGTYQVELILFRQSGEPAPVRRKSPQPMSAVRRSTIWSPNCRAVATMRC